MLKNYKIILAWLLSLLFGGIFLTSIVFLLDKSSNSWATYDLKRVLESFFYSSIFNVLASILPLTVLLIRNPILKRKKSPPKIYLLKLKKSLLISLSITLICMIMYGVLFELIPRMEIRGEFGLHFRDLMQFFILIGFYLASSLSVYFAYLIVFRKERKFIKQHRESEREDVIDHQSF